MHHELIWKESFYWKKLAGTLYHLMFTSHDPRVSRDQFHVSTQITELKSVQGYIRYEFLWACLMVLKCSRWVEICGHPFYVEIHFWKRTYEQQLFNDHSMTSQYLYATTIQSPFHNHSSNAVYSININKPKFLWQISSFTAWDSGCCPQIPCFIHLFGEMLQRPSHLKPCNTIWSHNQMATKWQPNACHDMKKISTRSKQ